MVRTSSSRKKNAQENNEDIQEHADNNRNNEYPDKN